MRKIIILTVSITLLMAPVASLKAETLSNRLKGKILLQTESKGEAWYVSPKTAERYYMANGDEAYNVMRTLGVGITNKDLDKIKASKVLAKKSSGKIFLQVESRGEAYYVDFNGTLHYLKDGSEAYNVMRTLGLGITNNDLEKVKVSKNDKQQTVAINTPETKIIKDQATEQEKPVIDNKELISNSNDLINKNIYSFNDTIVKLTQTKNSNLSFLANVQKQLSDYPNYYQYQNSGKQLISETNAENYLIDRLVSGVNNMIAELRNLLNTGKTTSENYKNLEIGQNNILSQFQVSSNKIKELIDTNAKDLSDEIKNELENKRNELQAIQDKTAQMKTECTEPLSDMQQQITQIKSDYYIAVEAIKKQPVSTSYINGKISQMTDDANLKIDILNNNIQQKSLDCANKFH